MWSKYVTRRLAVQLAQAWNFGWGKAMKKVYGVDLRDTLVFYDGKKTEYYVDLKQHEQYVLGLYKLLNNRTFLKTFHGGALKSLKKIKQTISGYCNKNLAKMSNRELLDIYQNFVLPNQAQFYVRMWSVFNIGEPLANVVKQHLVNYRLPANQTTAYLLSLSSPLKPNDVMVERMDLLKIALQKSAVSPQKFNKLIKNHTRKFRHIPVYDVDHNPYSEQHFFSEIKSLKNPGAELKKIKKIFTERKSGFQKILNRLKPDQKFKLLLYFLKDNVFLRDYRDKIRQQLNVELKKLYGEIGNRLKLTLYQTTLLTDEEIISHLKNGHAFSQKEIKRRQQAYLLIQKVAKVNIFSGQQAIAKARKELKSHASSSLKEIQGTTGSKGYARGKVKIIFTNKDLPKVNKGDILVATMTRQDFITAIRKAKALVTDEGSVTCHAAIIARELGIPCVVAARTATQIFKDGDLVEVDANKGIVKKI